MLFQSLASSCGGISGSDTTRPKMPNKAWKPDRQLLSQFHSLAFLSLGGFTFDVSQTRTSALVACPVIRTAFDFDLPLTSTLPTDFLRLEAKRNFKPEKSALVPVRKVSIGFQRFVYRRFEPVQFRRCLYQQRPLRPLFLVRCHVGNVSIQRG